MGAAPSPRRRAAIRAVLLSAALCAVAYADGDVARPRPPEPPGTQAGDASERVLSSWPVVVDAEHGFALRLPPGHDAARSGTIWYVHGWLDGEPLVPDLTITLAAGLSAVEIVERDFPPSARATPVAMGPATTGLRVTARYEHPDGSPYESVSYLVEGDVGTFRIDPYESFDWPSFEGVARSFHLVSFTRPWPPAGAEGPDTGGGSPTEPR